MASPLFPFASVKALPVSLIASTVAAGHVAGDMRQALGGSCVCTRNLLRICAGYEWDLIFFKFFGESVFQGGQRERKTQFCF